MRLAIAILILILATGLQSLLAGSGLFFDLIFATLIVFAFFFDFWEMAVFLLFGVFVVNWQPGIGLELFLFVLIPLLVFTFHTIFNSERWIAIPVSIVLGLSLFYLVAAPHYSFANPAPFLEDLCGGLAWGAAVFLALRRGNIHANA
jgi:hypothetical protein